ncbi:MAG: hypothetical protein HYX60_07375 [Legionella longbeachae]|nr:hypothetical protein [Legionella longbeachae]
MQQIHKKCEELKTSDKDSLWLFTAPEYLITESQPNQPVLPETKEYFIKKCMDLVAEFAPQLFLLPGTILTKKNITSPQLPEKLEQVHKYYSNLLEKFPALEDDEEFEKNKNNFKLKEIKNAKKVYLVRNSAMFFSLTAGENSSLRREVIDKKSPINECDIEDKTYNLFQVAKTHSKKHTKANFNPIIELEHPFTKEKFNIGIEICRDHHNQILQAYLENENTTPLLHFILSSTISYVKDCLTGYYNFHIDSLEENKMILRKKDQLNEKFSVEFEVCKLTYKNSTQYFASN